LQKASGFKVPNGLHFASHVIRLLPLIKRTQRSHCPIAFALDLFGDRWSLLLLRDLLFKDKRHYHELLAAEEGISTNILSERLARLEAEGLITKAPDPDNGRQYIYSPTQKALELIPVLLEIVLWSAKYDPETDAPPLIVRRIREDRDGFIREVVARFTTIKPKR